MEWAEVKKYRQQVIEEMNLQIDQTERMGIPIALMVVLVSPVLLVLIGMMACRAVVRVIKALIKWPYKVATIVPIGIYVFIDTSLICGWYLWLLIKKLSEEEK